MIVVKYGDEKCRGSAGWYAQPCEPRWSDDLYILCASCNWREVMDLELCKAETQEGARCKRKPHAVSGFCSHHQYQEETKNALRWVEIRQSILMAQMADALEQLPSFVYIIAANGFIKIGYSNNPEARLKTLKAEKNKTLRPPQVECSTMRIIKLVKGGKSLEGLLHAKCRKAHVIGEWFKHDSYTAEIIERLDDSWALT